MDMTGIYKLSRYLAFRQILLITSVVMFVACDRGPVDPDMNELPDLPATILPVLDGTSKSLEEYKGKSGMVVLFTDVRSDDARKAMKDYPAIASSLSEYDISAVIVNIGNPADQVRQYYSRNDYGLPVLYDTGDNTLKNWQIDSVPAVVYITGDGKIVYQGAAEWEVVSAVINRAVHPEKPLYFSNEEEILEERKP